MRASGLRSKALSLAAAREGKKGLDCCLLLRVRCTLTCSRSFSAQVGTRIRPVARRSSRARLQVIKLGVGAYFFFPTLARALPESRKLSFKVAARDETRLVSAVYVVSLGVRFILGCENSGWCTQSQC